MSDDEGRASGHVQDDPPPPDMPMVILLWCLIGSWVILTIFVLIVLVRMGAK